MAPGFRPSEVWSHAKGNAPAAAYVAAFGNVDSEQTMALSRGFAVDVLLSTSGRSAWARQSAAKR